MASLSPKKRHAWVTNVCRKCDAGRVSLAERALTPLRSGFILTRATTTRKEAYDGSCSLVPLGPGCNSPERYGASDEPVLRAGHNRRQRRHDVVAPAPPRGP